MNTFTRFFKSYNLSDVFTPTSVAKLTYVKRELIENDLEKYLSIPGKQIVVYGHSGSGKTTLLRNKLKSLKQNFIRTHCETSTTFEDILLQTFDALDRFYVSERSLNSQYSISKEAKASYKIISASVKDNYTKSKAEKNIRIVPPQLTPQKLAQFLGEINCVWIIEDFHKVSDEEKQRIADVIKIFIDTANDYPKVKVICIGAVGTASELILFDDNLTNRVAEIYVPLLDDDEILKILIKGSKLLNFKMSDALKEKIVYYSNNLASVAHQICFDLCFESNIKVSRIFPGIMQEDSFKTAVESFVRKNSDTFNMIYEQIECQKYGWHILKTFDFREKDYLSIDEIRRGIPHAKRPSTEELEEYLSELGSSEFNEIIRFNRNSKKYSISTPFFKAYLKMKLALEENEQWERKNKRKNKQSRRYNITNQKKRTVEDLILNDEFFQTYYQYLDSYIIKDLKSRENKFIRQNIIQPGNNKPQKK